MVQYEKNVRADPPEKGGFRAARKTDRKQEDMKQRQNAARGKRINALGANVGAITDGIADKNVHWDGGPAPAEAIVDLGAIYTLSGVRLVTYYGDGRAYRFKILVGRKSSGMTEVWEQTEDVEATEDGYRVDFEPIPARYVKVVMTHNTANPSVHIAELEAYGEFLCDAAKEETVFDCKDRDDIAFMKPTRANVNDAFSSLVTDGDPDSCWLGELYPRFVDVDLEENYFLDRVTVVAPAFADFEYAVYSSLDGVHFDRNGRVKTRKTGRSATLAMNGVKARVIRVMTVGTSQGARGASALCQVRAYGKKAGGKIIKTRKTIPIETYDSWLKRRCGVDLAPLKDQNGNYNVKDTYTSADTVKALEGLIARILGKKYISWFEFKIDRRAKKNYFELSEENGKIVIGADCGVSASAGLNHYLKYFCRVQVTQQTKQVKMPKSAPHVPEKIRMDANYPVRYAYNYCTLSYTMPYFGYEKWQRELDYLMLSGVNLILDLTATEALWVSYLQKLGYTADQAKDYVCGYTYKAWWLMGNLEGYGGPVADAWVTDTLEMARVNQRYMTVMGAQPALQTFVGAMPESFGELAGEHLREKGFGDVRPFLAPQGLWAGGFIRPNVLKTTYDGYSYLAKTFYDTQDEIYGQVSDYYCGDVCHEGGIVPADLSKPEMSAKILSELLRSDQNAVWMLQGWWSNPMKEVLDGFGALKKDHVIILDLAALANPKWTDKKIWDGVEFGSTPWIYCSLDNYGGRTGMHGKLKKMADLMTAARKTAKCMKGIGITPEGTNANPIVFDLFWEMAWRPEAPDMRLWLYEYLMRRYGSSCTPKDLEAWQIFEKTVYGLDTYDGTTKNNVINENACLRMGYCEGGYFKIKYDRDLFEEGVRAFMESFDLHVKNDGYVYDAVDLLRMTLTIACDDYFEVLKRARLVSDRKVFEEYSAKFLKAMKLIRELCTYNEDEMLGNWIGRGIDMTTGSRAGRYSDFDRDMMTYDAKILLTSWASSPITNYAARQFDGVMEDYFCKMWKKLFSNVGDALSEKKPAPDSLGSECFKIGWDLVLSDKAYRRSPADPAGSGKDRGLKKIYKDVLTHMGNKKELDGIVARLDKKIGKMKIKAERAGVSASIAATIEKK